MRNPWFQAVKPLSSASETLGFTTWKQGFQIVIWWVLERDFKTVYLCSFGEGKTVWGFRGKTIHWTALQLDNLDNSTTTLTTRQQPWQLDNNNNIILLYAYVKFVVHVVQWLFTLFNSCSRCWMVVHVVHVVVLPNLLRWLLMRLYRMGHGDPILRFMRYKIVRTITL